MSQNQAKGLTLFFPFFLFMCREPICSYLGGFIYLITWRIARRFAWRGLAVVVAVSAVIGPVRDYWYIARFPEWGEIGRAHV